MVALSDAILVLVPAATFGAGGLVRLVDKSDGNGPQIAYWDASLGTQPTAQALAAVTAGQVAAYYAALSVTAAQAALADTLSASGRSLQAVMGAANLVPAQVQARVAGTVPKSMYVIASAIFGLTSSQKTNLIANLFGGSPPLYQTDPGPNVGAIAAIYAALTNASGVATFNAAQQLIMAALYCQDNPTWLVNPAFDPTINVSGT